jgi:hypothetical protein
MAFGVLKHCACLLARFYCWSDAKAMVSPQFGAPRIKGVRACLASAHVASKRRHFHFCLAMLPCSAQQQSNGQSPVRPFKNPMTSHPILWPVWRRHRLNRHRRTLYKSDDSLRSQSAAAATPPRHSTANSTRQLPPARATTATPCARAGSGG